MLVSRYERTFSGTPDQVTLARSKVWITSLTVP